MTSSTTERNVRLEGILKHVQGKGSIDRRDLMSSIVKSFGVSGSTAREYIEDLLLRGALSEMYGQLSIKVEVSA